MNKLTVTLKTVTPLFLGGSNPNDTAELRTPSIKGALRFWYRAIDPEYNQKVKPSDPKSPTWEEKIFGSTEHGQGVFTINTDMPLEKENQWNPDRYNPLNVDHPNIPKNLTKNDLTEEEEKKKKTWIVNGIKYLSYSFNLGGNKRRYIKPGMSINLSFIFKKEIETKERKAILSSLWLLGHLGGLGSRSRRGFGTVSLQSIVTNWEEMNELPIANMESSIDKWTESFKKGLKTIKTWHLGEIIKDHTVIGEGTVFFIFKTGYSQKKINGKDFLPWELAVNEIGKAFQCFRQRYEPDYSNIKNSSINSSPERAAFGLPFSSRGHEFIGIHNNKECERNASPLHIRVIEINNSCHPLFLTLDAPLINIKLKKKEGVFDPPDRKILTDFIEQIKNDYEVIEITP